jgi:hypothetical protein
VFVNPAAGNLKEMLGFSGTMNLPVSVLERVHGGLFTHLGRVVQMASANPNPSMVYFKHSRVWDLLVLPTTGFINNIICMSC